MKYKVTIQFDAPEQLSELVLQAMRYMIAKLFVYNPHVVPGSFSISSESIKGEK